LEVKKLTSFNEKTNKTNSLVTSMIFLTGWNPFWSRNSRAAWQKKPNLSASFPRPYTQPTWKNLHQKILICKGQYNLWNIWKFSNQLNCSKE